MMLIRAICLLALLPAVLAQAQAQVPPQSAAFPAWGSAAAGKAVDDRAYPTGVDLAFPPNVPVALARAAVVVRADRPPARQPGWPSMVVDLMGEGPALTLRLVGVAASLRPGERSEAGRPLGSTADASQLWPGLPNHITLEVYRDGRRVDPRPLAIRLLPQGIPLDPRPPANAAATWPQWQLRQEAYAAARSDPRTAQARLRAALRYPGWKASNLDLAEDLGLAAAAAGDRSAQAAAARRMAQLARAELSYAQGQLPDLLLGPVSAARHPQYLQQALDRAEALASQLGGTAADDTD